jgi:hypothetical protein
MTATATLTGFTDLGTITAAAAGNSWGGAVTDVQAASDGTNLYIAVIMNPQNSGNNLYVSVSDSGMTTGTTDFSNYLTWGNLGITDGISAKMDLGLADYRTAEQLATPFATAGKAFAITDGTTGGTTSVASSVTMVQCTTAAGSNSGVATYKFQIPYTAIGSGAATGQKVSLYVWFGGTPSNIHSAWPAQASMATVTAGGSGMATLDTAPTPLVLN